jgi:hypothetical protein
MLRGTANAVRNAPANVRALYNRRRINKQKQIQEIAAAEARDAQIRADGQAGLIAAYREKLAKLAKSDNADDAKYNRIVAKLRKLGSEAEGFRLPPPPPPTYSEHNFRSHVLRSDPLQPPPPGSALGGFNPQ